MQSFLPLFFPSARNTETQAVNSRTYTYYRDRRFCEGILFMLVMSGKDVEHVSFSHPHTQKKRQSAAPASPWTRSTAGRGAGTSSPLSPGRSDRLRRRRRTSKQIWSECTSMYTYIISINIKHRFTIKNVSEFIDTSNDNIQRSILPVLQEFFCRFFSPAQPVLLRHRRGAGPRLPVRVRPRQRRVRRAGGALPGAKVGADVVYCTVNLRCTEVY